MDAIKMDEMDETSLQQFYAYCPLLSKSLLRTRNNDTFQSCSTNHVIHSKLRTSL